ncbi:3-oxoadipate enol-lactonase [soil metagenome]
MPGVTYLDLDDVQLYYELVGDGPPLLFLNGSGSTIESVRPLIDYLGTGCTVAVHDQRGSGRSSIPAGPYSMQDYARDARAMADHQGWDTFSVIGISFGGMVAQEFAVTWPERLDRLALLCTSPGGPDYASYPLERLRDLPEAERADLGLRLLDRRFVGDWLAEHPDDMSLVTRMVQGRNMDPSAEEDAAEVAQLGARSGHDVRERLGAITCPTLVAAGRYDGIAPVVNSEQIVDRLPNARLETFEGGHAFVAQDPAALPAVLAFLTDGA